MGYNPSVTKSQTLLNTHTHTHTHTHTWVLKNFLLLYFSVFQFLFGSVIPVYLLIFVIVFVIDF